MSSVVIRTRPDRCSTLEKSGRHHHSDTPLLSHSLSHYLMSRLAEIIAHKRQEIAPWLNHTEDWEERARGHRHFRKNHLKNTSVRHWVPIFLDYGSSSFRQRLRQLGQERTDP